MRKLPPERQRGSVVITQPEALFNYQSFWLSTRVIAFCSKRILVNGVYWCTVTKINAQHTTWLGSKQTRGLRGKCANRYCYGTPVERSVCTPTANPLVTRRFMSATRMQVCLLEVVEYVAENRLQLFWQSSRIYVHRKGETICYGVST